MEDALIDCSIPKETGCDAGLLEILERERIARGQRNTSTHNGDGGQHAKLGISHVHRSSLAMTAARALGKQFRHQELYWNAASHGVLVWTVRAGQHVAHLQSLADTHRGRFLSLRLVNGSGSKGVAARFKGAGTGGRVLPGFLA